MSSTGDTTAAITVSASLANGDSMTEISVLASNACGDVRDTFLVAFMPIPNATLPNDTALCGVASFSVNPVRQPLVSYVWRDESTGHSFTFTQTDSVWLEASNACGTDRDSITVVFYEEIKGLLGGDTSLCAGDTIVLNLSLTGASYTWGNGSNDSTFAITSAGKYFVTVTKPPCRSTFTIVVDYLADDCDTTALCRFILPNVFTPNGDGLNDLLAFTENCAIKEFSATIFNRWGQLLFQTTNPDQRWDGTINGKPAAEGVYFCIVEITDTAGMKSTHNGSFSLLR